MFEMHCLCQEAFVGSRQGRAVEIHLLFLPATELPFFALAALLHCRRSHISFSQAHLYIVEKDPTGIPEVCPWPLL